MNGTIRVRAQAKINLRLKVLGLEQSGYHAIETVFLRLELADRITVVTSAGGGIDLDVGGNSSLAIACGPADQNLALLAARSYVDRSGWNPRIEVRIEKVIPVGAGLGGGSTDAAAVLRALNYLAPSPLSDAELLALAATLGSDVPFLVTSDAMAVGWGRGERLDSMTPLPVRPVILAVPPVHVSTREAYAWLDRASGGAPEVSALPGDAFATWQRAVAYAENDFSSVVTQRYPVIAAIRESLLARGARIAMLTGSGSAVFGLFDSGDHGGHAVSMPGWREIATSTAAHVVPLERLD